MKSVSTLMTALALCALPVLATGAPGPLKAKTAKGVNIAALDAAVKPIKLGSVVLEGRPPTCSATRA